jgi:hypothetical protein
MINKYMNRYKNDSLLPKQTKRKKLQQQQQQQQHTISKQAKRESIKEKKQE